MSGISTAQPRRQALVIAFHYPPDNSSGMLRTLAFTRYLPLFSWKPLVLTCRPNVYPSLDEGKLCAVPPTVPVLRARAFDVKRLVSIRGRYPSLIELPDRYWPWLPFAVAAGRGLMRREEISLIYSTSPFPTAHLIARRLRKLSGKPWVADFRDPWVPPFARTRGLSGRLSASLERKVVEEADFVVTTTRRLRDSFARRYPDLPVDKFRVIYNGFDESDFSTLTAVPRHGKPQLEFVHTGTIYGEYRDPEPFLSALGALVRRGSIPTSGVRVKLVGSGEYVETSSFGARLDALGLREIVEILPRVPHEQSLHHLAAADVLLLFQYGDGVRTQLPAKVFEYMRVGKPILAILSDGETEDFMREHSCGLSVRHDDRGGLEGAIAELYRAWASEGLGEVGRVKRVERFSRERGAEQLAGLFGEIAERAVRQEGRA